MNHGLAIIEQTILSITPETSPDLIAETFDRIDALAAECRRVKSLLKDRLVEVIEETGREIVIGPKRYYAGTETEYVLRDNKASLSSLLEVLDIDTISGLLASEYLKHGAVRKALELAGCPERFDAIFETRKKTVLKDGKAVKQLLCSDERFVR